MSAGSSAVYERTRQKFPFDDTSVGICFFLYKRFVFFSLYTLENILEMQSTLITF